MRLRRWKSIAAIVILLLTVYLFASFFKNNPEVRQQLTQSDVETFITLLLLHLIGVVALAGILLATLRLCKLRLEPGESILLTAYSSVINFFGPLQSGPAFRAVYLKTKHGINLKSYASATLIYYFFYGVISGLMVVSGFGYVWLIATVIAIALLTFAGLSIQKVRTRFDALDLRGWYLLGTATLIQCIAVLAVYYTELATINSQISFGQAVVYTGAANLSLFVSITPGAIGFRESFLLFSQSLHNVSDETIVAASILDRAVYIAMLIILAVFIAATHAKSKFLKIKV